MKRILFVVIFALLSVAVMARPVDAVTARRVADTYMSAMGMRNTAALIDITARTSYTGFYVFAAEDGGFVLVSADDCVLPILGYSLTADFPLSGMPEHVAEWLGLYEEQIAFCRQHEDENAKGEAALQWQALLEGSLPPMPYTTAVSPMLTTSWGQGNRYNNYCPYDSAGGGRSVTGCTATAMAQVMKYWNHPTTGYGSHSYTTSSYGTLSANYGMTTYNWSSMPNSLSSSSSTTQIDAVATLMYHAGVSAEMNYSASGSGAATNAAGSLTRASAENALKTYFKYSPTLHGVYLREYSDEGWKELLRNELDNGRPLLYTGYDTSAGHAFVFDGYNIGGMFHVNWGWTGSYDGYYAIGALNPGSGGIGGNSTYTFNLSNSAIIGIKPVTTGWGNGGTVTVATAGGGTGCSVSGGGNYAFHDTVTLLATAAQGYRFDHWSDGNKRNSRKLVVSSGNINLTAHFAALAGDTLSYCGSSGYRLTSYSVSSHNNKWGIKLPSSSLIAGHKLEAVQLFVYKAGSYTLNVYSGTSLPTTLVYTTTVSYTSNQTDQWQTINLSTPASIDATKSLWVTFTCTASYPAAVTHYSGNNDGFCWGNNMATSTNRYSFMIRAIFLPPQHTVTVVSNNESLGHVFGSGVFNEGSIVSISAVPMTGCDFLYWTDGVTDNPRTFVLLSDTTFTAVFDTSRFTLAVVTADSTMGSVYGGGRYFEGSTAVIGANPVAGYRFMRWNDGFTDNPRSVTVTGNATYTAYFEPLPPASVTVLSNNSSWGTVTGGGSYTSGSVVTLAATPASGYHFVRWSNGVTDNPCVVIVTGDVTYIAYFEPEQYTVSVVSNNPDWGEVSGGGTYMAGYTATLTANANSSYRFVQWSDGSTSRVHNVTVTADTTYTAYFESEGGEGVEGVVDNVFGIYPNPVSSTLNLIVAEPGEASVLDAMGRSTANISVVPGTNTIDVSSLPNGVYFIKVGAIHYSFIKR